MSNIKIGVVGDGPIGNLVVAKLIIEHYYAIKNKNNNNNLQINHHTAKRNKITGYSRRHVLYITEELVKILEEQILMCDTCLTEIANKQFISEDTRKILLFSTRVLEETLYQHIIINKTQYCSTDTKCILEYIDKVFDINAPADDYTTYDYDFLFFAVGSNAPLIRKKYFYKGAGSNGNTIKIISDESEPIVAFYTKLGPHNAREEGHLMHSEDKDSSIKLVNKEELMKDHSINIYEL